MTIQGWLTTRANLVNRLLPLIAAQARLVRLFFCRLLLPLSCCLGSVRRRPASSVGVRLPSRRPRPRAVVSCCPPCCGYAICSLTRSLVAGSETLKRCNCTLSLSLLGAIPLRLCAFYKSSLAPISCCTPQLRRVQSLSPR